VEFPANAGVEAIAPLVINASATSEVRFGRVSLIMVSPCMLHEKQDRTSRHLPHFRFSVDAMWIEKKRAPLRLQTLCRLSAWERGVVKEK
jgi:hypothetical protein